jgi:hypothetical protein
MQSVQAEVDSSIMGKRRKDEPAAAGRAPESSMSSQSSAGADAAAGVVGVLSSSGELCRLLTATEVAPVIGKWALTRTARTSCDNDLTIADR